MNKQQKAKIVDNYIQITKDAIARGGTPRPDYVSFLVNRIMDLFPEHCIELSLTLKERLKNELGIEGRKEVEI